MSATGPLGPSNPFDGFGMFGDLARMLSSQGPLHWDAARQMALMLANEASSDTNVDPLVRIKWEELGRIAELHIQHVSGLDTSANGHPAVVVPVTPVVWADRTLTAYRPLFERLAGALHPPTVDPTVAVDPAGPPGAVDPFSPGADDDADTAMISGLFQLLGPSLLGMSAGSMIGHLARRNFASYDLPLPRPVSPELLVIDRNVTAFAEDWSLPIDDVRLWVCLSELAHHAVLSVPHVRAALEDLLGRFVAGFRPQPDALAQRLGDLEMGDAGPESLQRLFADPQVMLGAMASPEQRALEPALDALVAVLLGYVDHALDEASRGLVASGSRIAEATRRRRVEAGQSDQFVERLFGLSLSRQQVERGHAFVSGVLERAGDTGLTQLWRDARNLPTPAEVDAPGLWLARLEIDPT